jgi:putative lipoic acid-binding regulatory protein
MPDLPPLVDYPCQYEYKVIGRAGSDFQEWVLGLFRGVLGETMDRAKVEVILSGQGRFESVRVTVLLVSEEQRVAVYTALSNQPRIVFYL